MNPFLDSQEQRNTPRGCGFAGACQKLSLLPRKQSKLNQRSRPGRPTRWRRRIRSSRGRNRLWVEKRVQSGGLRSRKQVEPHTAPIAARSSTGSRFCTPLQPPGTTAAQAPAVGAPKSRTRCLPPRATTATATTAAGRVHILLPRSRERSLYIPPRSRAGASSRRRGNAPQARPWPPRRSAGARAHLRLMTLMSSCSTSSRSSPTSSLP